MGEGARLARLHHRPPILDLAHDIIAPPTRIHGKPAET